MITLYHCENSRSFRPLWAMCEMGMGFELKLLPFPPRGQPDYLALNPLGTDPLFIDGDTRMTESSAICHYLAVRHGPTPLAVAPEEPDFGAYLNWLSFGEATLTFPQTLVLRYRMLEPKERRSPQVAEDYERWFNNRLRAVEAAVAEREFLCSRRFTMADVSVGFALLLTDYLGLSARFKPAVQAYWERLQVRDGFEAALRAQENAATAEGLQPGSTFPRLDPSSAESVAGR